MKTPNWPIPAYPERSLNGYYPASAVATYAGGFERDLVLWGAPCSGTDRPDGKSACKSTHTYLDAGRPHCQLHLIRYCRHGTSGCSQCPTHREKPTITELLTIRPARPLER